MNFSQPDWRCQWFHAAIGTGVQREPSPPHPPTLGTTKILGRSWCTASQAQRGFQLHEGKQKPSLCQPPGREGQPCCPLHHGISCQGKHTTVQLWGKQHFHSERKNRGQNLLRWRGWVLAAVKASSCPSSDAGELAHARPAVKGLWPHSCGAWNSEAEDIQHRLKQNKETLIESETGKENPT